MEQRGQFTFYRSYYKAIMKQPKSRRWALCLALCEYALDGKEPELPDACMSAFEFVRPVLDTARVKASSGSICGYTQKNEKNQKNKKIFSPKSEIFSSENKKEIEKEKKTEIESEYESTGGTDDEAFEIFFESYPNAVSRNTVKKAWDEVVTDPQAVLESLKKWKRSKQWHREGGRFVPRAQKWLRERWFEADPVELPPMGATGELGDAELAAAMAIMDES